MFKENFLTRADLDEAAKLRRRQQYEEERKPRIFNAKQRVMGIDTDALQRQLAEQAFKKAKQLELKSLEEARLLSQAQAMHAMESAQQEQKRDLDADLNRYRCMYQRKELSRNYDLNDPHRLRNAPPIRCGDYDPALGLSSAQVFDGEDVGGRERRRRQREQQRAWLDQQIMERKQAETSKQQADDKWAETIFNRDQSLADMNAAERRVRGKILDHIDEFNRKMAAQKKAERERARQEKMEDDLAEIYNMLTSDLLRDNPAASCPPPNQLNRGPMPEDRVLFCQAQADQLNRIAQRKTQAKLMEHQWEQNALNVDRELKLKELELARREKNAFRSLVEENLALAKQQREQKLKANVELRNEITEEFFKKFNNTSR